MPVFKSKKNAALDEEGFYLVHHTDLNLNLNLEPTMTEHEKEPWHMKREIQIGHLIATIGVGVSAVFYIAKIEQRVAVVETQMDGQRDSANLLRLQLEKINDKLDRLIERTHL